MCLRVHRKLKGFVISQYFDKCPSLRKYTYPKDYLKVTRNRSFDSTLISTFSLYKSSLKFYESQSIRRQCYQMQGGCGEMFQENHSECLGTWHLSWRERLGRVAETYIARVIPVKLPGQSMVRYSSEELDCDRVCCCLFQLCFSSRRLAE